jgi:hypothetical protein
MADTKISALTAATTPLAGTEVVPLVQSGTTKKVAVSDLTAGRSMSASTVLIPGNNTGITTGDPVNILRFTDTDTTSAAGQPMGRIEWVSQDSGFEGVKGYIQVEAIDGSPDGDMIFATQHNTGAGLARRLKLSYDGDVTALTGNFVIGTAGKGIDFSATTEGSGTMTSELLNDYEEGTWTPVLSDASTGGNVAAVTAAGTYTKIGRQVTVRLSLDNINTSGMTSANQLFVQGLPFAAASDVSQGAGAMFVQRISFTGGAYSWTASVAASATVIAFFSPTGSDTNAATMKVSNILSTAADMYVTLTYFV